LPRCDAADDLPPKKKFLNLDAIASTTQGLLASRPAGESGGSTNACEDRSHDKEKQTFGQFLFNTF
jgi:hypothetical protein